MLSFERGGPRGGPTLVLIHPMGADLRFWDECRAQWEAKFDCLAMDLPAAGGSPDPGGDLTLDRQASLLADLVDENGIDEFVVVGCAVGAMISVHLIALLPGRSVAAVLTNPGKKIDGAAKEALAGRAAAVRANGIGFVATASLDAAFHGQTNRAARDSYAKHFMAQDPVCYARKIEGMLHADIGPDLEKVDCPVLLAVGGQDILLPPSIGRQIAADLAGATLIEYPRAAHFIPYQISQQFSRDVEQWLGSVQGN